MSIISASTTSTTAYKVTADTTGTLVLQTGSTPTTAVTVGTDQSVTLAGTLAVQGQTVSPYTGFKNRIINGAMVIDQRNAGSSVSISTGSANYTIDRWSASASGGGVFAAQRTSVVPAGFTNSFGLTVTTVDSSIASNDYYIFEQQIEGFNCSDLGFGTANASTVTVGFWVRSSLTGLASGRLCNSALNRSYVFTFTINSANTWEYKTATIAGDTSGTWLTDSGRGMSVTFNLTSGSSLTTSTIGSWVAGNFHGASTQTLNFIGTNGATFYITGVQLEKGSTATSFDYRPYGTELNLCQRYFEMSFQQGTAPANGASSTALLTEGGAVRTYAAGATGNDGAYVPYKVTKRANPTITAYGNSSGQWLTTSNANAGLTIVGGSDGGFSGYQTSTTAIVGFRGHWTSSAEL